MLLLIMQESKKNKVVALPVNQNSGYELLGADQVLTSRYWGAKILDLVTLGQYELTQRDKDNFNIINKSCREWNLPPLKGDF